jgi:uncharacterized membrane protein
MSWQKFYASDAIIWSFKETVNNIRLVLLSMLTLVGELMASVVLFVLPAMLYTMYAMPELRSALSSSYVSRFMCHMQPTWQLGMNLKISDISTAVIIVWCCIFFILAMLWSMFSAGYIRMLIKLHDNGTAEIRQMFLGWYRGPRVFVAGLIVLCGFILGLALFIIPGIYVLVHAILFPFFIIDKDAGIVESIRSSCKAVTGHGWQVGALVLLAMLCALHPIIKLLSSVPLVLSLIYAYKRLT